MATQVRPVSLESTTWRVSIEWLPAGRACSSACLQVPQWHLEPLRRSDSPTCQPHLELSKGVGVLTHAQGVPAGVPAVVFNESRA